MSQYNINLEECIAEELMKGASYCSVAEEVRRELQLLRENCPFNSANYRDAQNWSYLSGLIVGAEGKSLKNYNQ